MTTTRWPSLAGQYSLARRIHGERGCHVVDDWVAAQSALVDDPAFAAHFAAVRLPGVVANDFTHRRVRSARGALLGGIRFRARDTTRPFVEVIGHDFDRLDDLTDCVRAEWAVFAPRALRLFAPPGALTGPGIVPDLTVHAARCGEMTGYDRRVQLARFGDADRARDLVDRAYARLGAADPELRAAVTPADSGALGDWCASGSAHDVRSAGRTVGLFAVTPGNVNWLDGDEIQEEVVDPAHLGHGYAASAQAAYAHLISARDRLLLGTIDRLNVASRRTAERAGRPAVLQAVFAALTEFAPGSRIP